jgi:hypothetical protein
MGCKLVCDMAMELRGLERRVVVARCARRPGKGLTVGKSGGGQCKPAGLR